MKPFIVIVGVLAVVAISQAQSADGETKTDPSYGEDDGPPGHPGRHGSKPKIGLSAGPSGWSFHAPGISIEIGHPKVDQRQPEGQDSQSQPQPAESEESKEEQTPTSRFPIRRPVFFDLNGSGNHFGGHITVNKPSPTTTTTTWPPS